MRSLLNLVSMIGIVKSYVRLTRGLYAMYSWTMGLSTYYVISFLTILNTPSSSNVIRPPPSPHDDVIRKVLTACHDT